ncbi:DUF1566 domain-containing protein [Aquibaculum sediminis]|uniref:Lcl C-terminal domain-containing protein n=1 Tax=Aquibaculum sediminis TaxID=3231907 RepID=UPI0034536EF3
MRLIVFVFIFIITGIGPAAAQNCIGPDSDIGNAIFNTNYDVIQGCTAVHGWTTAFHEPGCPDGSGCHPCTGGSPPSLGQTCDDGTIYAGDTPDGDDPMYTTDADQSSGAFWGAYGFETESTSSVTGAANTANVYAHVRAGDGDYNPDDGYTPNAFVLCEELSAHGHDDWYLPARDELDVLYTNKNAGDLDGTFNESGSFPAGYYWSSSEDINYGACYQRFSDGNQFNVMKGNKIAVRCVRK